MKRFDPCRCGDTFGKHDDNGVCRVKDCGCIRFRPVASVRNQETELVIHRSYYATESPAEAETCPA